jgi:uncharacterized protein YydD (DUF2326 family)
LRSPQRLEDNQWLTQQLEERTLWVTDLKSQVKALEVQRDHNSGQQQALLEKLDTNQNHILELEKLLATATEKVNHLNETHATQRNTTEHLQNEQVYWEGENRRLQEAVKALESGQVAKLNK